MTLHHFTSLPALNRGFVMSIIGIMVLVAGGLLATTLYHTHTRDVWRIAVTSWPGFDVLYIAEKQGFFAANNLTIELVTINTTTDMRAAFERGLIDGYTIPLVDALESLQTSGVPARIALVTDFSNGGDQLLASPAFESTADLAGAKVGVESMTALGRYVLGQALQGTSLNLSNLNLVPGSQPELAQMAINGDLDALVTYQPFVSQIQERRDMRNLFSSAAIPGEIIDVVVISPHILKHDPTFTERLQNAWQQAVTYTTTHREETAMLNARRYGVPPAVYADMANGLTLFTARDMQKLVASKRLANTIHTTSHMLMPNAPLSAEDAHKLIAIYVPEYMQP